MSFYRSTLKLAAILFFFAIATLAQITTATISGTVSDSSGAIVPGAQITIRNAGTGLSRTLQSDAQGRYAAPNLSVGSYEIQVEIAGFQKELRTGVGLTVGQHAVINITLNPGAVAETVTITGEAPIVDTATSAVGALVNREQIHDLPLNGRDYTQLALLQPGVAANREQQTTDPARGTGVRMQISGARANQVSFRLNGLDISDGAGTTPGSATGHNLGLDAIQEFQVLTNTFSAEYGKAAGGIINVVQKSGTNNLHGSAFEYLRNNVLDARQFFDQGNVPPFKRNQFGASVGGPIRKDKTFFFGNYEGLRERLAVTETNVVLTQDAKNGAFGTVNPAVKPYLDAMPLPNGQTFSNGSGNRLIQAPTQSTEDYFVVKTDHAFSIADSLSTSYTFDQGKQVSASGQVTWNLTNNTRNQYFTLQETHIFSPTTINSFRAGFNRSNVLANRVPIIAMPQNISFLPGADFGTINVTGIDGFALTFGALNDTTIKVNSYQISDTVTRSRGSHSIKFGMDASRTKFTYASAPREVGGLYSFDSIPQFLSGNATIFQATDPGTSTAGRPTIYQNLFGFFFQDDIRLTSRLSVNAGVRYEFITTPHATKPIESNLVHLTDANLTTGQTWFNNPSLKNFAPRVGFAWDVFGNQKTAVRGGFGLYFDPITSYYYLPVIFKNPPFALTRTVNGAPFPNGFSLVQSGALPSTSSLTLEQYNLNQPYRIQWNLGIQQQILRNTSVTAYYVGSHSVHSTQFYWNVNTRLPQTLPDGSLFFSSNAPLLNPQFGIIQDRLTGGNSYYDALQLQVMHRMSGGFQIQGSFTWSKSLDTGSIFSYGNEAFNSAGLQQAFRPGAEKGLSDFDQRKVFKLNATYDLPFDNSLNRAAKAIAGGWQLGGILSLSSGLPFVPELGFDNANIITRSAGDNLRPNLAPGGNSNPISPQNVSRYFDPLQFTLPQPGTLGNLARNTVIGPGLATFDFTSKKRFQLSESKRLEFRAEFFNLLNRPNFQIPAESKRRLFNSQGRRNPSAGAITNQITSARQIQFSLRLEF